MTRLVQDARDLQSARKVLIIGSCFAYDLAMRLLPERGEFRYWWRNNTISLVAPFKEEVPDTSDIPLTKEESNTLKRDVTKNFPDDDIAWSDLIVVDLYRDTYSVLTTRGGTFVTRGAEYDKYPIDDQDMFMYNIRFGTTRHFDLWCDAIVKFADRIRRFDRPVVIVNPYVSPVQSEDGRYQVSASLRHGEVLRLNFILHHMNAILLDLLPEAVSLSFKPWAIGTWKGHPWGEAPIHYPPAAYDAVLSSLETDIATARLRTQSPEFRAILARQSEASAAAVREMVK